MLATCSRGYLRIVQVLVDKCGASLGAIMYKGTTPLMATCQNGHLMVVQYLLCCRG